MCCSIAHVHPTVSVDNVRYQGLVQGERLYRLSVTMDQSPKTKAQQVLQYMQWAKLAEKVSEIADESFHLFAALLRQYATVPLYTTLSAIHTGAHHLEHAIHSFCLVSDIASIAAGEFIVYHNRRHQQINYIETAARVFHTASHLLATITFVASMLVVSIGAIEVIAQYQFFLSAAGYGLSLSSVVWNKWKGRPNKQFISDVGLHLGGCVFNAMHQANMGGPIRAIAGIVHACCYAKRLWPKDVAHLHFNVAMNA